MRNIQLKLIEVIKIFTFQFLFQGHSNLIKSWAYLDLSGVAYSLQTIRKFDSLRETSVVQVLNHSQVCRPGIPEP